MKSSLLTLKATLSLALLFSIHSFASIAREPNLRELEKAALRYSNTDPQEITRLKHRSRLAALLPQVSFGYDQNLTQQFNSTIQDNISVSSSGVTIGPPDSRFNEDQDLKNDFAVKAVWNLSELVFNRDEVAISAEARYKTILRNQILEELQQTYFARRKILLQNASPSASTLLALEELEAKLDSLTGGFFSLIKNENQESKHNPLDSSAFPSETERTRL